MTSTRASRRRSTRSTQRRRATTFASFGRACPGLSKSREVPRAIPPARPPAVDCPPNGTPQLHRNRPFRAGRRFGGRLVQPIDISAIGPKSCVLGSTRCRFARSTKRGVLKMLRLRRPSPALIVAVAAVVIASSGTAVASGLISGKQIKNTPPARPRTSSSAPSSTSTGPAPGVPVILDAKRGDIGSTAQHYATEAFERYGADAVTLNPYLGRDALEPFLDTPTRASSCCAARPIPAARNSRTWPRGGQPLYQRVARDGRTRLERARQLPAGRRRDLAAGTRERARAGRRDAAPGAGRRRPGRRRGAGGAGGADPAAPA